MGCRDPYHRRVTEGTRVALALGSGGARGYAHIGVLQVLEERGFQVVGVSGTSMGALVGGLYAAGRLDAYTEWVSGLAPRDLWRLLDISVKAPGVIRGEKVMSRVADLLEGVLIEDLPIPYTAIATDLLTRSEVWFQEGPVEAAIRDFVTSADGRILGGETAPDQQLKRRIAFLCGQLLRFRTEYRAARQILKTRVGVGKPKQKRS